MTAPWWDPRDERHRYEDQGPLRPDERTGFGITPTGPGTQPEAGYDSSDSWSTTVAPGGWEPDRQYGGYTGRPYDMADQLLTGIRSYYAGGDWRGDYRASQPAWDRRYDAPVGAYGMVASNWPIDAEFAGIAGANMRDPAAQDRVARHKVNWLNERYRGDWDLTSLAWLHGAWVADDVLENGWRSLPFEKRELFDAFMAKVGPYIGQSDYVAGQHLAQGDNPDLQGQNGVRLEGQPTNPRYGETSYYSPSMNDANQFYKDMGMSNMAVRRSGHATLLDTGPGAPILPGSRMMISMFNEMSKRVAGGNRVPVDRLSQLQDTSSFGETIYGNQTPEDTTAETGRTSSGLLDYATTGEGDEVLTTGGGSQNWDSGYSSNHTYNTNAERLADEGYQAIATGTTAVIGEWLQDNMGVSVGQYRDLNVRPAGGAQYSDHYWGGALDVTGSVEQMDAVSRWVEQYGNELGVNYKLWQTANHYDHVHISFLPPGSEGAVTDGMAALASVGLVAPERPPLPPRRDRAQVGADVGSYTVPGNVR